MAFMATTSRNLPRVNAALRRLPLIPSTKVKKKHDTDDTDTKLQDYAQHMKTYNTDTKLHD